MGLFKRVYLHKAEWISFIAKFKKEPTIHYLIQLYLKRDVISFILSYELQALVFIISYFGFWHKYGTSYGKCCDVGCSPTFVFFRLESYNDTIFRSRQELEAWESMGGNHFPNVGNLQDEVREFK